MPYIKQEEREKLLDKEMREDRIVSPETPGDLNYCFTILANRYLNMKGVNYQHINDIIGALESAKMEFYRRIAVPYEDLKIEENGDVGTDNTINTYLIQQGLNK